MEADQSEDNGGGVALFATTEPSSISTRGRARGRGSTGKGGGRTGGQEGRYCDCCYKQGHLEDKCRKKFSKPDWATNKDLAPSDAPTPNVVEYISQSASASITLSHEDFKLLLKLAHGETTPPSVVVTHSGKLDAPQTPWLVDSRATVHMANTPLFST